MNTKNWASRLIFATILMSVVRYSAAFAASDIGAITGGWSKLINVLVALTGVGMGILDTAGGGFLFNGWSRVFPRNGAAWSLKFKVLTFCVFSLIVSGMIILVPFTLSRLAGESILVTLGGKESIWSWVWATMVNFIPYVIIAGVFTGNRMVEQMESSEPIRKPSETETESSGNFPTNWRKARPLLSIEYVIQIANAPTEWIMKTYKLSDKTARNWRHYAQDEIGIPQEEGNDGRTEE